MSLPTDIVSVKTGAENVEWLAAIVSSSDAAIIGRKLDGTIVTWNRGAEKLFGHTEAEAVGQPMRLMFPQERRQEEIEILARIARGESLDHFETVLIHKHGRRIDVAMTVSPLRDEAGRTAGISQIVRDISGRKRSETHWQEVIAELQWRTAFFEAQVHSALDGMLVVDNHGRKILQNQRLIDLFHIPTELADESDDTGLLHHFTNQMKDPAQFLERVMWLYAHPDEIGRDEVVLASGTVLDRYSAPVRDLSGHHYGRIWTFRDITESRKLEVQLRQSQKMEAIGHLAGGVAHDFNNILAIIMVQAELVKFGGPLSTEQAGFADEIIATVKRAAALTRQLLLFSRREVFQPRDLNLTESIAQTAKMLGRILGENIHMELKLAGAPMLVHADPSMMDQVLMNLAVNARDAMPSGGRLIVETRGVELDDFSAAQHPQARPGSFVCLSVSDTGCGIPAEIMPKIFEPFFTTKDVGKGTGLGLATTFGIVQQHQGWINVYSEVGQGTTFHIHLPRLFKDAITQSNDPTLAAARTGDETILLVEDDPTLRVSVRKALAQLGYRIIEASSGVQALELWKQNQTNIRLLLTDMVMPDGMTGKQLSERLRQESPKLKVIYMSGYSAEVIGKNFPLQEGVNFLIKPFKAAYLAQTVRHCLDATA